MSYLPGETLKERWFGQEIPVEVLVERDKRGRLLGRVPSGGKIVLEEHFFEKSVDTRDEE